MGNFLTRSNRVDNFHPTALESIGSMPSLPSKRRFHFIDKILEIKTKFFNFVINHFHYFYYYLDLIQDVSSQDCRLEEQNKDKHRRHYLFALLCGLLVYFDGVVLSLFNDFKTAALSDLFYHKIYPPSFWHHTDVIH